jgi:hypothetical protein
MAPVFDTMDLADEKLRFLDAPELAGIAALAAYWDRKRGARALADRADIDPTEIVPLLPHLVICETLDGGADFRVRLFGTGLVELVGEERTGKCLSEFGIDCDPPTQAGIVRRRWMDVTRRAFDTRRPAFATGRMSSSNRSYIVWHAVSCPLTVGGTEIGQMLGAMMIAR